VTGHVEQVYQLMGEATVLPDGPAKLALVQRASEIADSHQDVELAFEVRKTMLGVCLGADACDLMLVTFTWCLAQHDRDPQAFPAHRLLWEFRWVVSSLCTFPEVTKTKIEEMKAEMARRYQHYGASPRSYWMMCRKMAVDMGDVKKATAADREYRRSPRDWLTDDVAAEADFEINYRLLRKDYAQALRAAEPLVSKKFQSEHHEGGACADVLLPLLRAGRAAEAMPLHRRGYKLRANKIRHLDSIAKHIAFLGLTGNFARGVRLFEKHLAETMKTTNAFTRMRFLIDTLPLLDRLKKAGNGNQMVRVPADCPLSVDGDRQPAGEVRDRMRDAAAVLAQTFDERNGNDYYTRRLAAAPRLQRLYSPCPLN
jgi:hypothetical protein